MCVVFAYNNRGRNNSIKMTGLKTPTFKTMMFVELQHYSDGSVAVLRSFNKQTGIGKASARRAKKKFESAESKGEAEL